IFNETMHHSHGAGEWMVRKPAEDLEETAPGLCPNLLLPCDQIAFVRAGSSAEKKTRYKSNNPAIAASATAQSFTLSTNSRTTIRFPASDFCRFMGMSRTLSPKFLHCKQI